MLYFFIIFTVFHLNFHVFVFIKTKQKIQTKKSNIGSVHNNAVECNIKMMHQTIYHYLSLMLYFMNCNKLY